VTVTFPLPAGVKSKDVVVDIKARAIRVREGGGVVCVAVDIKARGPYG
jgi:hypothetical protein